ncbi:hypothetical protein KL924_002222 [Ogataea haglerorum]|nr:hypothetical protein KL924_002222 [Ogataea haglerorum]
MPRLSAGDVGPRLAPNAAVLKRSKEIKKRFEEAAVRVQSFPCIKLNMVPRIVSKTGNYSLWQFYDNYTTDMILGQYDPSPGTYLASSQQSQPQYVTNSPATRNMYSTEHLISINSIPSPDGKKQPTFPGTDSTVLKKFRCSQCTSSFTRRSRLKEHCRKVHEGEKLVFICDHCHKVMSSRENLNRHIIGHTDKYRCAYCGKRHDRADRYQRHMRKCSAKHSDTQFPAQEAV